jgi:type I restriction enzyme S subunit
MMPMRSSPRSVPLGKLAGFVMGQAPPGKDCNKSGVGTPFVRAGEFGALYPEVCAWTTKPLKLSLRGDVLLCVVGATAGKVNMAIDSAIGRSVAAVRPVGELNERYLYHYLTSQTMTLRNGSRGSAQGVITLRDLAAIAVPLVTLDEQQRIVDILEDHLSRLDAADCSMTSAMNRANTLRASIIDRAARGSLDGAEATQDGLARGWAWVPPRAPAKSPVIRRL